MLATYRAVQIARNVAVPAAGACLFSERLRSFAVTYLREDRRRDPFGWVVEHDLCPLVALGLGRRVQFLAGPLIDSQASACPLVRHVCRPCPGGLPNRFLLAFYAPMAHGEILRNRRTEASFGASRGTDDQHSGAVIVPKRGAGHGSKVIAVSRGRHRDAHTCPGNLAQSFYPPAPRSSGYSHGVADLYAVSCR